MSNAAVMTPRAQRSHGGPACEPPNHTSGARTYSVEMCSGGNDYTPAAGLLQPMSQIFKHSSRLSRRFAILKSMCAIPL